MNITKHLIFNVSVADHSFEGTEINILNFQILYNKINK